MPKKYDLTKLGFFDRTIENCKVIAIPAGAVPKTVTVELPYEDAPRALARYKGHPPGLAVDDYVDVRINPRGNPQFVITGTSAGTGTAMVILADVIENLGDLLVGTGAAAVDNLPVGADGQVLTADSGETLGVKWAAVSGGNIWPAPDKLMIGASEYSTMAAAVAAIVTGDQLIIGWGAYACEESVADIDAYLLGGGETSVLTKTDPASTNVLELTTDNPVTANYFVERLTIAGISTNLAINSLKIDGSGTTVVICRRVKATISQSQNVLSACFNVAGGTVYLFDCEAAVSGAGNAKYCLYIAAGDCIIKGGYFAGDLYQAGGTLTLEGPTITGTITGTWSGWYVDSSGNVVFSRLSSDWQIIKPNYPTEDIWRTDAGSKSDFVATINGTPSGTSVVYNTPSSGDENNLVPASTSQIGKMVLHNTTRGDEALISNCNAGTNTITLTATVPGTWANGDTITIRSQTNTSNPGTNVYFVDFEIVSGIDALAASLIFFSVCRDSSSATQQIVVFHPYEASAISKRRTTRTPPVVGQYQDWTSPPIPLISNRFCLSWDASGTGTMTLIVRLSAEGAPYQ